MRERRSDDELFEAVRAGDRAALGALFERHCDGMLRFARAALGDNAEAHDAVQDAFVRIVRYSGSYTRRDAFVGWLYTVLRNGCHDRRAARAREHDALSRAAAEPAWAEPKLPDPRLDALREAVGALSPDRREALVLRRLRGLSYAEIAEICDTTEGAARVRVHRALDELRRILVPPTERSHDD